MTINDQLQLRSQKFNLSESCSKYAGICLISLIRENPYSIKRLWLREANAPSHTPWWRCWLIDFVTEHPGSIVGFADSTSSQKLLISSNATSTSTSGSTTVTVVSTANFNSDGNSPGHNNFIRKDKSQQHMHQHQQHYAGKQTRVGGNEYHGTKNI